MRSVPRALIYFLGVVSLAAGATSQDPDGFCEFSSDPDNPSPIFWYIQNFTITWLELPPMDQDDTAVNALIYDIALKNILVDGLVYCSGTIEEGMTWNRCVTESGQQLGKGPWTWSHVGRNNDVVTLAMHQDWECEEEQHVFVGEGSTEFQGFVCNGDKEVSTSLKHGECVPDDLAMAGEITVWGSVIATGMD